MTWVWFWVGIDGLWNLFLLSRCIYRILRAVVIMLARIVFLVIIRRSVVVVIVWMVFISRIARRWRAVLRTWRLWRLAFKLAFRIVRVVVFRYRLPFFVFFLRISLYLFVLLRLLVYRSESLFYCECRKFLLFVMLWWIVFNVFPFVTLSRLQLRLK